MGTALVHTVLDDHSRVAYAEIRNDETAAIAAAVLRNAVAWFTDRGITIQRVLSDNGWAFKQLYPTEQARRDALPAGLHHYNHHQPRPPPANSHPSPA